MRYNLTDWHVELTEFDFWPCGDQKMEALFYDRTVLEYVHYCGRRDAIYEERKKSFAARPNVSRLHLFFILMLMSSFVVS